MKNRDLCDMVKPIVNLASNQIDEFLSICVDAVVHNVATTLSDNSNGRIKFLDMEIPYIGIMTADVDENGKLSNISITLNEDLDNKLSLAITEFKSPLINRAESVVTSMIAKKYKSLL